MRDKLFRTNVFISHDWLSWPDRSALYYLRDCLMSLGANCFLDDRSLVELTDLQMDLAERVAGTDIMVCLVSEAYMRKLQSKIPGEWIQAEVKTAFRLKAHLVPIQVDNINPRRLRKEERAQYELHLGHALSSLNIETKKPQTKQDKEDIMTLARTVLEMPRKV